MIHLNLTHGESTGTENTGTCLVCDTKTILVTANSWHTHPEDGDDDFVEPNDEISGHYCPECNRITAIFFNESPRQCP